MATPGDISKYFKWNEDKKQYDLQYWRHSVKPFTLYFDGQTGDVTIPASPAIRRFDFRPTYSANQGLDNGYGQPSLAHQLTFSDTTDGNAAANWNVLLRQINHSRSLMDIPIHIRNLAGTGQQPFILREPLLMRSNSVVTAQLQMVTAGPTTARLNLRPANYYPYSNFLTLDHMVKENIEGIIGKWFVRSNYIYPFWATTTEQYPATLSANGISELFYHQPQDSCFEIWGITSVHTSVQYDYALDIPRIRQSISNGWVSAECGTGTPQFPYIFPTTHLIHPGMKLRIRLRDRSGAPNSVRFVLFGRKIIAPPTKVFEVLKDLEIPDEHGYRPVLNSKLVYGQVDMLQPDIEGRK